MTPEINARLREVKRSCQRSTAFLIFMILFIIGVIMCSIVGWIYIFRAVEVIKFINNS